MIDPNKTDIRWVRFKKDEKPITGLTIQQHQMLEALRKDEEVKDEIRFEIINKKLYANYVRIFRAAEGCITCHNSQGSAGAFNRGEPIGAVIIEIPATETRRTTLLNRVWIIVAMLIGGTGAFVAFYIIMQRVILRPSASCERWPITSPKETSISEAQ